MCKCILAFYYFNCFVCFVPLPTYFGCKKMKEISGIIDQEYHKELTDRFDFIDTGERKSLLLLVLWCGKFSF